MITDSDYLCEGLDRISSVEEFETWTRRELRLSLPHAALLGTIGKLYGSGSVPTHRVSVDFPLNMVEALKNNIGALDDPLMYGWFRSEKLRHIHVDEIEEFGGQQQWRKVLVSYGMRSMMIHGLLDHSARRFAVFQICNPHNGGLPENTRLFNSLVRNMAMAAWRTVDNRSEGSVGTLIGHPTLSLTPAEMHIIELLAQGLSNKEIARLRGVSDSTVKTQVQRTGAKLGATRRAEIVAIAMPMLFPLPAQALIDYGDSRHEG